FKFCSTFDSTPQGNIGPVIDALLQSLSARGAVVCPAVPWVGRTQYMGHLFVGDRLLNESGMEKHPLTPMTDPDIRRWLGHQSRFPIGLIPHQIVRGGVEAINKAINGEISSGRPLVLVDATTEEDIISIATALDDDLLVTGGAGLALGLP